MRLYPIPRWWMLAVGMAVQAHAAALFHSDDKGDILVQMSSPWSKAGSTIEVSAAYFEFSSGLLTNITAHAQWFVVPFGASILDGRFIAAISNLYRITVIYASASQTVAIAVLPSLDPGDDADGDGLPNAYELAHGLNPLDAADAEADNDGDGVNNRLEYLAGTDPNVATFTCNGMTNETSVSGFAGYVITNVDRLVWRADDADVAPGIQSFGWSGKTRQIFALFGAHYQKELMRTRTPMPAQCSVAASRLPYYAGDRLFMSRSRTKLEMPMLGGDLVWMQSKADAVAITNCDSWGLIYYNGGDPAFGMFVAQPHMRKLTDLHQWLPDLPLNADVSCCLSSRWHYLAPPAGDGDLPLDYYAAYVEAVPHYLHFLYSLYRIEFADQTNTTSFALDHTQFMISNAPAVVCGRLALWPGLPLDTIACRWRAGTGTWQTNVFMLTREPAHDDPDLPGITNLYFNLVTTMDVRCLYTVEFFFDINTNAVLDDQEERLAANFAVMPDYIPSLFGATVYGPAVVCPNQTYCYTVQASGAPPSVITYAWENPSRSSRTSAWYRMPSVGGKHIQCTAKAYGQSSVVSMTANVLRVALVPNYDRNNCIDNADRLNAVEGETYYFWINNDDDESPNTGNDRPGVDRADWKDSNWLPFAGSYLVDGVRDFIDFFPLWIDIRDALDVCPYSEYDYVIRHSEGAFNAFVKPGLMPSEADIHLRNQMFCEANSNAVLERITSDGYTLPLSFLYDAMNNNRSLMLLEARAATQAPLVLEIRKKTNGQVSYSAELNVSISSVENMFRHKNLRAVAGGSGGQPNRLGEPPNYPDSLTIGKHLVYVHGYNVNGNDAHGSQCEVFKRLYWSGSMAKFHGVTWYGDQTQLHVSDLTPNYHVNVINAFNTAPALKTYLDELSGNGEVIVAAHSLGNMLASSSIVLHGAMVNKYIIINGAVPIEAYRADQPKEWGMVHSDWDDYLFDGTNDFLFASEWYKLFDSSDPRSKLTWRGLFSSWNGTTVYNYFTPGEDVVANTAHGQGDLFDIRGYAWGCQEKLKGRMPIGYVVGSRQAGWGFNTSDYGSWQLFNDLPFWVREPAASARLIPPLALKSKPFFHTTPETLFSANEAEAQSYAQSNKYWLLARAIPASAYGAGANTIAISSGITSLDMQSEMHKGWYKNKIQWGHSSFLEVAFLYTYPMYNQLVTHGGLK